MRSGKLREGNSNEAPLGHNGGAPLEDISSNPGRLTMSLWPEAGRALGLGRNSTYDAAARGEIPTIRFGKLIRVPVKALERLLEQAGQGRATSPYPKTESRP
jgi:excisionase family DNA binding protein